ncbi:UDP-N-acetylglucosamine 1-carboxyvinyltransferase [Alicycliphilus sp. B1]|nr:UDP-N-acetylglucosamine 1-carboxyvinyltransferase [Alicycliphilus sp. B1]
MITVTGTENLLMAATLAEGETVLENAAQEPEVTDLAEMLIRHGRAHRGPRHEPHPHPGCGAACTAARIQVVADRIEAGTFLCAVAAAGGEAFLRHARADHLDAVIDKLLEAGARVAAEGDGIRISSPGGAELKAQSFRTTEYPGFPTDMQAQFMALNVVAQGNGHGGRDDLREPLHARQRTGAPGRADRHRRPRGHGDGRRAALGRHRHGHRPARLGQPGDRRPDRQRRDPGGPHLPPGPRLRRHGSQAAQPWARTSKGIQ